MEKPFKIGDQVYLPESFDSEYFRHGGIVLECKGDFTYVKWHVTNEIWKCKTIRLELKERKKKLTTEKRERLILGEYSELYRTEIKSYEELSRIIKTRGRLVY